MSKVVIIVPSRGRPDKLRQMSMAARSTASQEIEIVSGIDTDDRDMDAYLEIPGIHFYTSTRKNLSTWTNYLADMTLLDKVPPDFLVSMGDDHMCRTMNWDIKLIEAIQGLGAPGFAFGDDGQNAVSLCTSWMVSAEIVKALGWMMLPTLNHMYVDNLTLDLGNAADRIVYCPDVFIEHMHPTAHKANWDKTYTESFQSGQYIKDARTFRRWRYSIEFEQAVSKIKGLE